MYTTYVYMTPAYYKMVFGRDEKTGQVLVALKDDTDQSADTLSARASEV